MRKERSVKMNEDLNKCHIFNMDGRKYLGLRSKFHKKQRNHAKDMIQIDHFKVKIK